MGRRWMMLVVLVVGLGGSVGLAQAWGGHRWGGPRVAIGIGLGSFWAPFWAPYTAPVVVPPPVVVTPAPSVMAPPPTFWYYCENPQGYYPYVPQCPSGWRAVSPTPAP